MFLFYYISFNKVLQNTIELFGVDSTHKKGNRLATQLLNIWTIIHFKNKKI